VATVITQNELLDALAKANAAPSEARTVAELEQLTGWDRKRLRDAIGRLALQNRIDVHNVPRTAISGRSTRVPAYTIKPAPKHTKP
jgi:hypothetical protein